MATNTINNAFFQAVLNMKFGSHFPVAAQPMITNLMDMLNQPIGGSATFSVTLTGNTSNPTNIRWTHDSVEIENMADKYSGADTLSLTISNLIAEDAGNYGLFVLVDEEPLFPTSAMLTICESTE